MPMHTFAVGPYAGVATDGRYDPGDLRDAIESAIARFAPSHPKALLLDFSLSQELATRETAQIRAMAYFLASRGDTFGGRLAMVAPSDVAFGLMRLGSVTTERNGLNTRVFRTYAEAIQWLDGASAAD